MKRIVVALAAFLATVASAGDYRTFHVPPDRVPPPGLCRIWHRDLPPDRQPPAMSCARAHAIAADHGGRVIQAIGPQSYQTGEVAASRYGRADVGGVPPDRLPAPGYCRAWFDGNPPDRQPPVMPCPHAERIARAYGGRVLYMPSTDLY